ncbi:zinc ribbon domain-containing protein [Eubacteriaceae bacterium ES2]|nr:zinc ribbon domain-containing protein [Eubacteriaceae bacterium ES2]
MANDLFGGLGDSLGGIMKGLSGLMPQDDPNVKVFSVKAKLDGLIAEEEKIYAQIGRIAVKKYGLETFPEWQEQLGLVQKNRLATENELEQIQQEVESANREQEQKINARTCNVCGFENPEGTKFCQECGNRLGQVQKIICPTCGVEVAPGTRFCGECGAQLG